MMTVMMNLIIGIILFFICTKVVFSQDVSKEELDKLISTFVKERSQKGSFFIKDPRSGKDIELIFIGPREIFRHIRNYGYFVDVYFHEKEDHNKKWDIDFWIRNEGGKLVIKDVQVHKVPEKVGGEWFMVTVEPLPWWWQQSSGEHGGEPIARGDWKAWAVKAAIHEYIADKVSKDKAFIIKDPTTGEDVKLELVAIHDPVRKFPKKGLYFACADFRPVDGPGDKLYDIDIFLKNEGGKLSVADVKVHKVPVFQDGRWVKKALFYYKDEDIVELP